MYWRFSVTFRILNDLEWYDDLLLLPQPPNKVEGDCLQNLEFTTQRIKDSFKQIQTVRRLFNGVGRLHSYESSLIGRSFAGVREVSLSVDNVPWMLARTVCSEQCLMRLSADNLPLGVYLSQYQYRRAVVEYSILNDFNFKRFFSKVYLRRNVWSSSGRSKIILIEIFLTCLDFNAGQQK
jgi:chorismate-pyruvate lyase